jgi:DNA-binding response OmpR family regulator
MSQSIYRVLVADDDPTVALLMPVALDANEFSVVVVENGEDALTEFGRSPYDIVVLDIEMPGMNGFEVCAAIRRSRGRDLPVVLVSGHRDPEFVARAVALSAGYITKPVDWQLISTQLKAFLMESRSATSD